MTPFEKDNKTLFIAFGNILKVRGLEIEYNEDTPHLGEGISNGEWCFYIKPPNIRFNKTKEEIEDMFPINIEGYTFEFREYFSEEALDWNIHPQYVLFTIKKDGENVLKGFDF